MLIHLGTLSHAAGALLFLLLSALLATAWRGRMRGALLLTACLVSAIWCAALAWQSLTGHLSFTAIGLLEVVRNGAWIAFLLRVLGAARGEERGPDRHLRPFIVPAVMACAGIAALLLFQPYLSPEFLSRRAGISLLVFGQVVVAVLGLVLVEQFYRNTLPEHRWAIKFLCFGVGAIFAFDFFLYSKALLYRQMDPGLWMARGVINALAVPLIAVSAARSPSWSVEIFVSRHIVFHSAALLGAGCYLILMAGAGYYIRLYGGNWGGVAQAVFFFGAVLLLALLMLSGQLRARAKVFLAKHFFRNKYDYREEWLKFTETLSRSEHDSNVKENIIRAIAGIVESPGGVMWARGEDARFQPVAAWHAAFPVTAKVPADSSLVGFLREREWIIFLDEITGDPELYAGLELPSWLEKYQNPWVILPLMHGAEVLGFVLLTRSQTKRQLNWEDSDLLRTVGRQAASYLALLGLSDALADARQFEAFNRLSSYVVHDLKNLVAQLSLVGENARKHGSNPEFIRDAFGTVANATAKMNRLLGQLRKGRMDETTSKMVNLKPILHKVVKARAINQPRPVVQHIDEGLIVTTDAERLGTMVEHIIQNAQEATADDGEVRVRGERDGQQVIIEVEDSGCGMAPQFIAERLFRPFDTTKGNAGMGIGVYESREFFRGRGGDVEVASTPGKGTVFRLILPLAGAEPTVEEEIQTSMEMAK